MILGFLPIILWEVFSVLYYGFPFPNTYYAKLTTGIPQSELYQQGWLYFQNSLTWDHITLPVIALGVLFSFFQRKPKQISLALGIVLYLGYILNIGGDFMSGRFFSAPFLLSLALISEFAKDMEREDRSGFFPCHNLSRFVCRFHLAQTTYAYSSNRT